MLGVQEDRTCAEKQTVKQNTLKFIEIEYEFEQQYASNKMLCDHISISRTFNFKYFRDMQIQLLISNKNFVIYSFNKQNNKTVNLTLLCYEYQ